MEVIDFVKKCITKICDTFVVIRLRMFAKFSLLYIAIYVYRDILYFIQRRRFFPVELIENLLDAMSYLKMNVLHFHFSDLCQFSVESMLFPELTSTLQQYYTQQDVKNLIQYAHDRGIRVIPEIDVP